MWKERKICIRITPRRVMGSILIAASVVNLFIVGMAFELSFPEAVPSATPTRTTDPATITVSAPTVTETGIPTATFESTGTPTQTPTLTPTVSPTSTGSPTPTVALCLPRSSWPVYIVQGGDTLYSLAIATGSSVDELMLANCLPDTRIYRGQSLYVPRLPISTVTPSNTPPTPVNSPAEFMPDAMSCDYPTAVSFAVEVYDPEGIRTVEVLVYAQVEESIELAAQIIMEPDGDTYYGSGDLSRPFTVYDIVYYRFNAVDSFDDETISPAYEDRSSDCIELLLAPQEGIE